MKKEKIEDYTCQVCGRVWWFHLKGRPCLQCLTSRFVFLIIDKLGLPQPCQCYWEDEKTFLECEACAEARTRQRGKK